MGEAADNTKQRSLSQQASRNSILSLVLFLTLVGIIFGASWRDREGMASLASVYEDQFKVEQFKASLIKILSPLNEFALGGGTDTAPKLKKAIADYNGSYTGIEAIAHLGDEQKAALLQVHNLMSEVMNIAEDVASGKIQAGQADQVIMLAQNLVLKAQDKLELIVSGMEKTLEAKSAAHESQATTQLYALFAFIFVIGVLIDWLNRKLLAKAQELSRASSSVALSADDILNANEEQANATGQQSRFIERVVKGLELVAESGTKIEATAIAMEKNIHNTTSLANGCAEEVSGVRSAMDQMQGTVDGVASQSGLMVQDLDDALKVLGRVGEVAEEAQLLALNASIESSGAGSLTSEVQRISDEVRQLSDDVRNSLSRLREQGAANEASLQQVLGGIASSQEAGQRIADLLEKSRGQSEKASQAAGMIGQATQRQNDRNQKILQALNYISELLHISGSKLEASREASMRLSQASASLQNLS